MLSNGFMSRVLIGCFVLAMGLMGCGKPSSSAPEGLPGSYIGAGEFHGTQGSLDAKAQLEIKEGGNYQLLWLEPSPMALFGVESGTWAESGGSVVLTPVVKEIKEGDGTFAKLSSASSKSAVSKTLVKEGAGMKWSDGNMDLVFKKAN
jgi:hypothetical protein